MVKVIWQDFESWKKEGIDRGYEGRNPNSLARSDKETERSWYFNAWYQNRAKGRLAWFD